MKLRRCFAHREIGMDFCGYGQVNAFDVNFHDGFGMLSYFWSAFFEGFKVDRVMGDKFQPGHFPL